MPYRDRKKAYEAIKDWERRNPDKMKAARRRYKLKKLYGITTEEYGRLVKKQKQRCATCRKRAFLVVDHCHKRKHVRALLCHQCNIMLGHAKDSPRLLRRLADYLESNKR